MTPTGIRGLGSKTPRTEAQALFPQFSIRRISEMLDVDETQVQEWVFGKPRQQVKGRGRGISQASESQRAKVKGKRSILGGEGPCDPCHIWPRGLGGCDDPLCVFPAIRPEHRAFDQGKLDILPALIAHGYVEELAHALIHANGDLIALLERVTGDTWRPMLTGGPE